MKQISFLPKFVFKCRDKFTWHRMDNEKPMIEKQTALTRKRELGEDKCATGYRIIKHNNRYFLYEKKN